MTHRRYTVLLWSAADKSLRAEIPITSATADLAAKRAQRRLRQAQADLPEGMRWDRWTLRIRVAQSHLCQVIAQGGPSTTVWHAHAHQRMAQAHG